MGTTELGHLAQASPALLANWRSFFSFSTGWSASDVARARAAWPKALQLTKKLYDRGVLVTGQPASATWTTDQRAQYAEVMGTRWLERPGQQPVKR